MTDFDDAIERVKAASPIETVMEKLGHRFERETGISRRVAHSGGLVVSIPKQRYFWATHGWRGDVIDFVMRSQNLEFREAVDYLADLAGVQRPNWGRVDYEAIKQARTFESILEIALRVMVRWLHEDAEALDYLHRRGLTDETIAKEHIGFSGRGGDAFYREMRSEFALYGVDQSEPGAVAVLGYWGDVRAWARSRNISEGLLDADWIEKGRISGLLSVPGIVYAHYEGRRLVYLTRRHLPGHDRIRQADGSEREWKSWNPSNAVAGQRHVYFNHVWAAQAQECLVVEGQMDAITLAQWGWPAVALCGLAGTPDAMAALRQKLSRHLVVYLALDMDAAGQAQAQKLAYELGPLTRLVRWQFEPEPESDEAAAERRLAEAVAVCRVALAEGKKITVAFVQRALGVGYRAAVTLHGQVLDALADETIGEQALQEVADALA